MFIDPTSKSRVPATDPTAGGTPDDTDLVLAVADDGRGFDVRAVEKIRNRGGHLGLISMQERASLIEAELDIESSPGQGTRIGLRVPRLPNSVPS